MTVDLSVLVVIGVQLAALGLAIGLLGTRIERRWPGARSGVIMGRTFGIIGGIALIALSFAAGETPMSGTPNPIPGTVTSIQAGAELYQANCAACHGVDAKGGGPLAGTTKVPPPSLVDHVGAHPDGDLFYWIKTGRPGGMPSFATQLSDEQIWDLVNYLRSIERR